MVDARLKDGSRVNAVIPPLAIDGPILSIRRFGATPLAAEDLLRNKAMSPPMLDLLRAAVQARLNIVVSGGTGSGKTTLLNVLSGFISEKERILTIEDSAELQLRQRHVVRLECRPTQRGGQRRRAPEGTDHQCAAHAAGPHRGWRNARRRGHRHASGDEYRPRRIDHHRPRQHAARRLGAPRNYVHDGRQLPDTARVRAWNTRIS
jgi:energy-coupling factor transporter ATP-binding protein EcfA2